MARFTGTVGGGEGTGPQGEPGAPGADGSDGLDSLFLGTWDSVAYFLSIYPSGPGSLPAGDYWAFVKDNENPNKVYVVRQDPASQTGWVIDNNEHFVLPAGAQGDPGADGADGSDGTNGTNGADGSQGPQGDPGPMPFNYQGDFDYGVTYAGNDAVTFQGALWKLNNFIGAAGYAPTPGQWTLIIPAGTNGTDGADGVDGTNGNDGAPGADGSQGPQGDPGSPGLVYLGNYVSGNGYIANIAVVKGSDNNLYIATSSGGLGDPVGNTAEWAIFLPKGADGTAGDLGDFTIVDSTITSEADISIESNSGDIILNADGNVYKGSSTNGNEIVSYNNMDAYIGDATVNGSTGNTITDRIAAVSTGNLTSVGSDILPSTDNTYSLGDADHRWSSIHLGPGTLYITDTVTGDDAALTVTDGVLEIDGANQLQVGDLKFVDNTIESVTPEIDIQIGLTTSSGSLILNRDTAIPQTLTVGNEGTGTNEITLSGLPMIGQIKSEVFGVGENGWAAEVSLQRHSDTFPVILSGSRSFGDTSTDVDVEVGEALFLLMANGYAGTEYKNFANILFKVESDGEVAVSDTSSPGMIEFQVAPNGSTSPITAMTIHADQTVEHANGNVWGATPPTDSHGSAGDRYGMIAFTEEYIYYCVENYSPNNDGIWKRTRLSLHDDVEHPYTPVLSAYGDQPVFGTTGPDIVGRYVQNGELIHFTIAVTFSDIVDHGTGGYKITLPFNVKHDTAFHGQFISNAEGEYMVFGNVDAGNNVLSLKLHLSGPLSPFEPSQSLPFGQYDELTITGTYMKENA